MYYVHVFSANDDGFTYHHKSDIVHKHKIEALKSALKMLKLMHETFKVEVNVMTMFNHTATIAGKSVSGVMCVSVGIPFSFFTPKLQLEGDNITYDPSLPDNIKVTSVPEC